MSEHHPISDLMTETMSKIKEMVDVNTIIGNPIVAADGTTVIPVSKVSFGFGAGGSEFASKHAASGSPLAFGGGSGASARLEPVAFLIIRGDSVRLLPVAPGPISTVDRIADAVPEVVDKVTEFIEKQQEKKAQETELG